MAYSDTYNITLYNKGLPVCIYIYIKYIVPSTPNVPVLYNPLIIDVEIFFPLKISNSQKKKLFNLSENIMKYEDILSIYYMIRLTGCVEAENKYNIEFEECLHNKYCVNENECNNDIEYYLSNKSFWD